MCFKISYECAKICSRNSESTINKTYRLLYFFPRKFKNQTCQESVFVHEYY